MTSAADFEKLLNRFNDILIEKSQVGDLLLDNREVQQHLTCGSLVWMGCQHKIDNFFEFF